MGILAVNTFTHSAQFPKDEIDTLAAVANQAAIVIENARLHEQLQEQATTDCVTGLFNHRHIHERLQEELARAKRSKSCFAVMMMDVDRFKQFNDTHGHLLGDEALRFIAQRLRQTLREADIVGRYGGDEFLAILPGATSEEAKHVGERVTSIFADRPFPAKRANRFVALSMSVGIACYPDDSAKGEILVGLADAALYKAKRLGGNRVTSVRAPARTVPSRKKVPA